MREILAKNNGKRTTFYGTFIKFGVKKAHSNYFLKTILLKDVTNLDKTIISDHNWFIVNKEFGKLKKLKDGDIVKFDARITEYSKGLPITGEKVTDYKLASPTKICIYKRKTSIKTKIEKLKEQKTNNLSNRMFYIYFVYNNIVKEMIKQTMLMRIINKTKEFIHESKKIKKYCNYLNEKAMIVKNPDFDLLFIIGTKENPLFEKNKKNLKPLLMKYGALKKASFVVVKYTESSCYHLFSTEYIAKTAQFIGEIKKVFNTKITKEKEYKIELKYSIVKTFKNTNFKNN